MAPAPLDPVFPSTDYVGYVIGANDNSVSPLTNALWNLSPDLKAARIKVYGWGDVGGNFSSSQHSNSPASYDLVPNSIQLDQACVILERVPDTVQKDHVDWGFHLTNLYGMDYRYTTAQGFFSNQLLKSNNLYGYDMVDAYGLLYIPSVADGLEIRVGRYISPPDIEAQLAPQNYLYTHSVMFGVDAYTMTGARADFKLSNDWTIGAGVHAGTDVAPWAGGAHPSAQLEVRWTANDNNNSVYGGIDSMNNGQYKDFHDNLQQFNLTWSHRFSQELHCVTEIYYLYSYNALEGGTVSFGPVHSFGGGGGPGASLPGLSTAFGAVNNFEYKLNKKDYLSFRTDFLNDPRGWRTGVATNYGSLTFGYSHQLSDLFVIRPEIRVEKSFNANGYDLGTKNAQVMFGMDLLGHF